MAKTEEKEERTNEKKIEKLNKKQQK